MSTIATTITTTNSTQSSSLAFEDNFEEEEMKLVDEYLGLEDCLNDNNNECNNNNTLSHNEEKKANETPQFVKRISEQEYRLQTEDFTKQEVNKLFNFVNEEKLSKKNKDKVLKLFYYGIITTFIYLAYLFGPMLSKIALLSNNSNNN
ncbi:hypothetical protein ABK040_007620 [Willaertia magna]